VVRLKEENPKGFFIQGEEEGWAGEQEGDLGAKKDFEKISEHKEPREDTEKEFEEAELEQ
jgi:hypothetical protein